MKSLLNKIISWCDDALQRLIDSLEYPIFPVPEPNTKEQEMRTEWRKRKKSDVWHFIPSCSNWPKGLDVLIRNVKPTYGELCNQCLAKERRKKASA